MLKPLLYVINDLFNKRGRNTNKIYESKKRIPKEYTEIGERIKAIRKQLEMNQSEFANFIGCKAKANISHIETGRVLPTLSQLVTISKIGKVPIHWIVTGEQDDYRIHELKDQIKQLNYDNSKLKSALNLLTN